MASAARRLAFRLKGVKTQFQRRIGVLTPFTEMATRLRAAGQRLQALAARLDAERMATMHEMGFTDDHVTTPGDARRLRYYDPTVNDAVPPEPFED